MKYYQMARKVSANSTLLDQESHDLVAFCSGHLFPKDFNGPFIVSLDAEFIDGEMATLYMDPAVIATKAFYKDLTDLGIDNIEVQPVIIQDHVNNRQIHDYVLLNIIGRVSCADMDASEYSELGDDMNIIDKLVINPAKTHGLLFFVVHEDTDCIIVHEKIYKALAAKGYHDIYFEELDQV